MPKLRYFPLCLSYLVALVIGTYKQISNYWVFLVVIEVRKFTHEWYVIDKGFASIGAVRGGEEGFRVLEPPTLYGLSEIISQKHTCKIKNGQVCNLSAVCVLSCDKIS